MDLISLQEVLWTDIRGIMVLFILVIEQYPSYSNSKHSQTGHSQKHHLGYLIGLGYNKSSEDFMLPSVMHYF